MLSSCDKDPYQDGTPELPPITMEGKNTLGFLLDGKVWVPYQVNPGIFTPTLNTVLDATTNTISVEARLSKKGETKTMFNILVTLTNEGDFKIPEMDNSITFLDDNFIICYEYRCVSKDGLLKISKFEKNLRIISGEFSLNEMTNICGDTIRITEGRFDLKF